MAEENKKTTVQIDNDIKNKLEFISQSYRRSMAGQISYMIEIEYQRLKAAKLALPEPVVSDEE